MSLKLAAAFLGFILLAGIILIVSTGAKPQNIEPVNVKPEQNQSKAVEVIAQNLEIPWALAFLPDGNILFTERPGRVRMIDKDGKLLASPVATIEKVNHIGEGGLLGIALHPNFSTNNYVYLYYTYKDKGENFNRVERYQYSVIKLTIACSEKDKDCNDAPTPRLSKDKIIIDRIPSSSNHNGGRIKFGPDKLLYITTGDAANPSEAQDKTSLAGKILRVTDEGDPAPGNPFGNLIYTYGHRNPQGLAWDNQGRLWAAEHGPSTRDELNLIEIGKNYGWPTIQGDEKRTGLETPVINSGSDTWAPAGAAFYRGFVFFGGLRGQALFQFDPSSKDLKEHFKGQFGRIREVVLGPDNFLYITTSNKDGRGAVKEGDDKIIKIDPQKLLIP